MIIKLVKNYLFIFYRRNVFNQVKALTTGYPLIIIIMLKLRRCGSKSLGLVSVAQTPYHDCSYHIAIINYKL